MEHAAIPDPFGFADLTKAEQIRYLQALWDRIAEQPEDIPVPPSHLDLVMERLAEYRRDPRRPHAAFDALDRLSRRGR